MQRLARLALTVVGLILLAGDCQPALPQTVFEHLVMPGPLSKAHAKLESSCVNCHEPFSKPGQTKLCLSCHKATAEDRTNRRGFHGKHPEAAKAECNSCHTEHKGRAADIVQFDRETFEHRFSNFDLRGAHKSTRCETCHVPPAKFRGTQSQCIDCHKTADVHKGGMGVQCSSCHHEVNWKQVKTFDHSKTRFGLTSSHARLDCASCHVGGRYRDTPRTCVGCHGLQDPHQGRHGTKCEGCHTTEKWKGAKFDHAKVARFPLIGKHTSLTCESCHTTSLQQAKPSRTCIGCHKQDDRHKGELGTRCEQCHNESSWREKVKFDHDLTRFPLIGLHSAVPCEDCHKSASHKDVLKTCSACHSDDPHKGRLGTSCGQCHNPNGWRHVTFDHGKQTQFALTGAHKSLTCQSCHRDKGGTKAPLDRACISCHAADDVHQGAFGRTCDKCHGVETFKPRGLRQ